jgi:hypothetical protein
MKFKLFQWLALVLVFLGPFSASAQTGALAAPKGKVILTVSGAISNSNRAALAVLDAAMIDALPVHAIKTNTPWYKKPVTFSGPLLADVLKLVGAKGNTLVIKALNDYLVKVPSDDANLYQVILARKADGKVLSVREKGPLFLMYPFDTKPELKNDIYYGRSIWQIASISVQ